MADGGVTLVDITYGHGGEQNQEKIDPWDLLFTSLVLESFI